MERASKIVELVGLAGAGKSTIAGALDQCSHQILLAEPPYSRRIRDIPFFAWNTFLLLPTLVHLWCTNQGSRWLSRQEIASMVILLGWHRRLRRSSSNRCQVIVLDQGPICSLMLLQLFGPETLRSAGAKKWWNRVCRRWADTLDTMIWLDAPTATLIERVRAREKWHGVKDKSEAEAFEYLERYREAYRRVIACLAVNDDLQILKFDTAQESLDGVVDQILAEFRLKPSRARDVC